MCYESLRIVLMSRVDGPVEQLLGERLADIEAIRRKIDDSGPPGRVFQSLPRHLRRRAASHNCYKLPRALIDKGKEDIAKFGTTVPKPSPKNPTRAAKRNQSSLRNPNKRFKHKHTWLETHMWHVKRFHMSPMWGFMLPTHSTQRGNKAVHRFSHNQAIVHDASYMTHLVLQGDSSALSSYLSERLYTRDGMSAGAAAMQSGAVSRNFLLRNESEIVCPVNVLWSHGGHKVMVAFHPSATNAIGLFSSTAEVTVSPATLSRIELSGPRALEIALRGLRPLDEHLNRVSGASTVSTPASEFWSALAAQAKSIRVPQTDELPSWQVIRMVVADPRLLKFDVKPLDADLPSAHARRLADLQASRTVPSEDIEIPEKLEAEVRNAAPAASRWSESGEAAGFAPLPALERSTGDTSLCQPNKPDIFVAATAYVPGAPRPPEPVPESTAAINERRGKQAAPADVKPQGDQPEIVILVEKEDCSPRLTILAPPLFCFPFFHSFYHLGARAVGVEERAVCLAESGYFPFPQCSLDTLAGRQHQLDRATDRLSKHFARPPAKRRVAVHTCSSTLDDSFPALDALHAALQPADTDFVWEIAGQKLYGLNACDAAAGRLNTPPPMPAGTSEDTTALRDLIAAYERAEHRRMVRRRAVRRAKAAWVEGNETKKLPEKVPPLVLPIPHGTICASRPPLVAHRGARAGGVDGALWAVRVVAHKGSLPPLSRIYTSDTEPSRERKGSSVDWKPSLLPTGVVVMGGFSFSAGCGAGLGYILRVANEKPCREAYYRAPGSPEYQKCTLTVVNCL